MYNLNQLMTFVKVAELGSFNRVAETEFMSPNAVMKQINNLENELGGIRLFERSKKGNSLTLAGEMLYREAKSIIEHCEESQAKIKRTLIYAENTIIIAATVDMDLNYFKPLFKEIHKRVPELRIEIKPIVYDVKTSKVLWNDFNSITDVLFTMIDGVKEGTEYRGMQVRGLPIAESHLYATMSNNNRLAEKDVLTLNDLKGETITVLSGDSGLMCEKLIDYIEEHNPDIILNKKDYFDYATMNEFANDGQIALDYYGGSYSHPCLVSIPLVIEGMEEEFCSKMGFMYTEPLSNAMKKFITTMQDILEETPDIMPKYERIKY